MLTEKKVKILKEMFNYCEICKTKFKPEELNIHHIRRKSNGGTDDLCNLKIVCSKCHRLLHWGEFR